MGMREEKYVCVCVCNGDGRAGEVTRTKDGMGRNGQAERYFDRGFVML
jgi:hypothetical protein